MYSLLLKNSNSNFKVLRFNRYISLITLKKTKNDLNYSKINSFYTNKTLKQEIEHLLPIFSNVSFKLCDSFSLFKTSNIQKNKETENNQDKSTNESSNKNFRQPGPVGMVILMITFLAFNLIYTKQLEELNKKVKEKEQELLKMEQNKKSNPNQVNNENNSSIQKSYSAGIADLQAYFGKRNHSLITWNEFASQVLPSQQVSEILANRKNDLVFISLKNPIIMNNVKIYYLHMNIPPDEIERKLEKAQNDLNIRRENQLVVTFKDASFSSNLVTVAVFCMLGYLLFRGVKAFSTKLKTMQGDMFSQFGKAKYSMIDPHLKSGAPKIQFKDVAGLHEAKVEVKEFVDYLRDPYRFQKLGAKVPKGALLLGPPGCGKTLLAKAVANEANVPFFNMAGTEFIEMIGGLGASRVRNLFEEARKQSPAIIYIDEIDAIGRKRSDANAQGSNSEADQTLNQLLVCMDGLESNSNIVVLASTNRADILDKALLRPGRLDRHITIELPDHSERIEILNVHMQNLKLNFMGKEKDDFVSQISHLTPRFSGADLANICNESALLAARDGQTFVTKKNFYSALERVIGGAEKKNTTITVEDRKLIAYRECGHIIISWYHKYADLILKVSLLSRTKSNAFSQYLPSEKKLHSKEDLFDQMCLHFGGRCAEQLIFNCVTSNSEKDLKRITSLAYAQVESLGMNDVIGNMSFPTQAELKASGSTVGEKPYSKKLRGVIDDEARKLVSQAHSSAYKTLNSNLDKLHKLAEELLKKESLTYQEIVQIIGEPSNKNRYSLANAHLMDQVESK